MLKNLLAVILSVGAGVLTLAAAEVELLTNRDFARVKNNVPQDWEFHNNSTHKSYKLVPGNSSEPSYVSITGEDAKSLGILMQAKYQKWPRGSQVEVSGEYRTRDIEFGQGGRIYVSLMCRSSWHAKAPQCWLGTTLKTADRWTRFNYRDRLSFDVVSISLYAALRNIKGTVEYRNLSLKITPPTAKLAAKERVVWREAEAIDRVSLVSQWGKTLKADYFSGQGGIFLNRKPFIWNFQIAPVVDPVSLFEQPQTWYLWLRVYGYCDGPDIHIYRNEKYMSNVGTPINEKVDKQGKYQGPGHYTWVLAGKFTTKGGAQNFSIRPRGRMLLDAMILTTDARYAPQDFEAKSFPQTKIIDVITPHSIHAEYSLEGVCDNLILPISFRCGGKRMVIPNNQAPAVFHFSLPENIRVKGVTSHGAGTNWRDPGCWGKKFLTWKKVGTRQVRGQKICDYEAYLYFVSNNQILIFLQADKAGFRPGTHSFCEYYLEHQGSKQLPEKIALQHISIKPTKSFKNIYIGANYVPFRMLYYSWPNCLDNLSQCGINYIGAWSSTAYPELPAFIQEAYKRNFRMALVVNLFQNGVSKEELATGIDGKIIAESGRPGKFASLALDENSRSIKLNMDLTRQCAALGVSVIYDDEMFSVSWNKVDYSSRTKALFRQWLTQRGKTYVEPEIIVRNSKSYPELYAAWVDFKCARLASWYALYRRAFDEGVKLAAGKYPPHLKPLLLTCVLGSDISPEELKQSSCLDYRLLNQYCDNIFMMSYTYDGVGSAARPGDMLQRFNTYLGNNNTSVVLLAGGYGSEVTAENKVMLKYEIWEALMQKTKFIEFFAGATLFNAPTLAPVVEAIRIARPYEDFFVQGQAYHKMQGSEKYLRLKALKLGSKVLLYAANYFNPVQKKVTVKFTEPVKKVVSVNSEQPVKLTDNGITFDFKGSRGRFFLLEF